MYLIQLNLPYVPFKNDDDRKNPENDDNEESENWTQELRREQE